MPDCERNNSELKIEWIEDNRGMERLLSAIDNSSAIGLDLESDGLHHYGEKLCLLQISTGDIVFIVDALASVDLNTLKPFLEDDSKTKIFHDVLFDGRMLAREVSCELRGIFDTMIAARVLGKKRVGLASLLKEYYGIDQDKRHQRADWSKRPLSEKLITYAAADTAYLTDLKDKLTKELKSKDRLKWATEDFEVACNRIEPMSQMMPDAYRIRGSGQLDAKGRAVLQSLLEMRDRIARERDVPCFKVISNRSLIEIAQACPQSVSSLKAIRCLSNSQERVLGKRIIDAVKKGMKKKPVKDNRIDKEKRRMSPSQKALLREIEKWKEKTAFKLDMDAGFLLPRVAAEKVAIELSNNGHLDNLIGEGILRSWQAELLKNDSRIHLASKNKGNI